MLPVDCTEHVALGKKYICDIKSFEIFQFAVVYKSRQARLLDSVLIYTCSHVCTIKTTIIR